MRFDTTQEGTYTGGMEVRLSPDKQARLQEIAIRLGKNTEQIVEEAVDRMLEYEESFVAAVEEGRSSTRRGELLEHDEVVERIDKILRS
jgi:predicted transcriptional regulator